MDKNILDTLKKKTGLITFKEASEKDIVKLHQMLNLSSFPEIPDDYCNFLRRTDGLIFNDIELYGCNIHKRQGYDFPNIEFVAKLTAGNSFFHKNIIIGLVSEEIIVYDNENKVYAVIDRVTLDSLAQYDSFAEILNFLICQ